MKVPFVKKLVVAAAVCASLAGGVPAVEAHGYGGGWGGWGGGFGLPLLGQMPLLGGIFGGTTQMCVRQLNGIVVCPQASYPSGYNYGYGQGYGAPYETVPSYPDYEPLK